MFVKRVEPDLELQAKIITAATAFEGKIAEIVAEYHATVASLNLIPTERRAIEEIII